MGGTVQIGQPATPRPVGPPGVGGVPVRPEYHEVQEARIHTLPDGPVPIHWPPGSAAGRLRRTGMTVAWADSERDGVEVALRTWPGDLLPELR